MGHVCNFCNSTFTTKSYLNYHQKNTKYCLEKQGINGCKNFVCQYCNKQLSSEKRLKTHYNTCKQYEFTTLKLKYEDQIRFLKEELKKKEKSIRELQDKLENVAIQAVKRHTTSNKTEINNFIQNMPPVTDDLLTDNVKHLSIDHILKGPQGYAEYALEYPLKDRVLCSDYSRRKIKFKNEDGTLIIDPEMTTLAKKFFGSIKDKNKELIFNCTDQVKDKFGDTGVLDTVVKLMGYKADVDNCSYGEKTEFHHDFVKQVCSKTIKE